MTGSTSPAAARDPFRIEGPATISFSGGRTSAYMLRRILDSHGGTLPDGVHVLFANTGKERPETLDFVEECSRRWSVRVRWIEYDVYSPFLRCDVGADGLRFEPGEAFHTYREVNRATASRRGEPFDALIRTRRFLPNPVMRMCTQELKVRPMREFARDAGFEHWTQALGLRADEPRRVAKALAPTGQRWESECPLAAAGITERDVLAFWREQSFDLQLRSHEGNCDLCFMKGRGILQRIMRARPDLATWWIDQEAIGLGDEGDMRFRHDRAPYARMLAIVHETPFLPGLGLEEDDNAMPCACTD